MAINPAVAALAQALLAMPPRTDSQIVQTPPTPDEVAAANQALYGSPAGPISPQTWDQNQTVAIVPGSVLYGTTPNIHGGVSPMASGFWKITLIIGASPYGKSVSTVWNSGSTSSTSDTALPNAQAFAQQYSDLFGLTSYPASPPGTVNSPYVQYIRITDAQNPRVGKLYTNAGALYGGPVLATGVTDNSADFVSKCVRIRMRGVNSYTDPVTGLPAVATATPNFTFIGLPDNAYMDNTVNWSTPMGVTTLGTIMANNLAQWNNPSNKLGFMGQDETQKKVTMQAFSVVAGSWQFTATAHGWASRDRVRVTGCNNNFFNGVYRVNVVDANTAQLINGPPLSLAIPTTGTAQRIQYANGTRANAFYQYALSGSALTVPFAAHIGKANPARLFVAVSFRRRRRRPH